MYIRVVTSTYMKVTNPISFIKWRIQHTLSTKSFGNELAQF